MVAMASHKIATEHSKDLDLASALDQIQISHGETYTPLASEQVQLERNYQSFLNLTASYR
jgi:hypothetical protein